MMLFYCCRTPVNAIGGAEWSVSEWAERVGALTVTTFIEAFIQAGHCSEVVAQDKHVIIPAWLLARLTGKRFGVALRDVGLYCPFAWCLNFDEPHDWKRCARMQRFLHPKTTWAGVLWRYAITAVRRYLMRRADRIYSVSNYLGMLHGVSDRIEVVR